MHGSIERSTSVRVSNMYHFSVLRYLEKVICTF